MSFSLLRLPDEAVQNVLMNMNFLERTCISFLSTRTKNLVTSLHMKIDAVVLVSGPSQIIEVYKGELLFVWLFSCEKVNDCPLAIRAQYRNEEPIQWYDQKKITMTKYVTHILDIFMMSSIKYVELQTEDPLDDVKKCISGLNVEMFPIRNVSRAFLNEIIRTFNPLNSLVLRDIDFEDQNTLPAICVQNFDEVTIDDINNAKITLNNLLTINCSNIRISSPSLSEKELNRFLKLWMQGSNPRMRSLIIDLWLQEDPGIKMIAKDTSLQFLPDGAKKEFKSFETDEVVDITNGYF